MERGVLRDSVQSPMNKMKKFPGESSPAASLNRDFRSRTRTDEMSDHHGKSTPVI